MKRALYCIAMILGCLACATTSTHFTGSWRNPNESNKSYSSIIITAMSRNMDARQSVENDLAARIGAEGIKTVKSLDVIPPEFTDGDEVDKEALLKKIRSQRTQGILTVALIKKETENRYVPGSYGYAPVTRFGYYGRFMGYYTNWYPTMLSPGYYTDDNIYFIETNLYDSKTEDLIWSAQSETYNPSDLKSFSKEFAELVTQELKREGLLGKARIEAKRTN